MKKQQGGEPGVEERAICDDEKKIGSCKVAEVLSWSRFTKWRGRSHGTREPGANDVFCIFHGRALSLAQLWGPPESSRNEGDGLRITLLDRSQCTVIGRGGRLRVLSRTTTTARSCENLT